MLSGGKLRPHGVFCGGSIPPAVSSETNKLRLTFLSDNSVEKTGFAGVFFTGVAGRSSGGVEVYTVHLPSKGKKNVSPMYCQFVNCTYRFSFGRQACIKRPVNYLKHI